MMGKENDGGNKTGKLTMITLYDTPPNLWAGCSSAADVYDAIS